MFCPNCGNDLPESAGFCPACGAKISVTKEQIGEQPKAESYNQTYDQQYAYQSEDYINPDAGKVDFVTAIKLFFQNYANFEGRATKSEYWWAVLFNVLASTAVSFIPYVGAVASVALLIPGLSVSVRRLHDTGKKWTYMLIELIPIVGVILLILQYCKDSDGDNKWGPRAR